MSYSPKETLEKPVFSLMAFNREIQMSVLLLLLSMCVHAQVGKIIAVGNPIITDKYTADPAALVYRDTAC